MDISITPASHLNGTITVPGDKSISHRSVMIGAISEGDTIIEGFLSAADPLSTLRCVNALGIRHTIESEKIIIHGNGLHGFQKSIAQLDAGNSGTTLRLLSGILAGQAFTTSISGDQYLVKRPMQRIIDPLQRMGAQIDSSEQRTAPLTIHGKFPLQAIDYESPIPSAQVKSAIIFAGLFADGITRVIESTSSRDHTERMLHLPQTMKNGKSIIEVTGGTRLECQSFHIPGDPSSAAFFIVAALIVPHSEITLNDIGINPTRIGYLKVLKDMNADVIIKNQRIIGGEPIGDLVVKSSHLRSDMVLEGAIIPNIIDEIPILAVTAAFSDGNFIVRDAKELRFKETDRIAAICANLRLMGIDVDEYDDGFAFVSKKELFHGAFNSYDDHRIAMAFGIASLALRDESKISDAECVSISFPSFWQTVEKLKQ
jgi:3-phosphoshikimate 1-carboxyvinyltransferase